MSEGEGEGDGDQRRRNGAGPVTTVYVLDAYADPAMKEPGAPASDQPAPVRFGPFPRPIKVNYDLIEGADGSNIGYFDQEGGLWRIDGLVFSGFEVIAIAASEVVEGTGELQDGQPTSVRRPTRRYSAMESPGS